MNCPYCGREMERGEVFSSHGIHWCKRSGSGERSAGMPLVKPTAKNFFTGVVKGFTVEGYRCPDCNKIILSLNKT